MGDVRQLDAQQVQQADTEHDEADQEHDNARLSIPEAECERKLNLRWMAGYEPSSRAERCAQDRLYRKTA